jgi:hypothetical protein
MAATPNATTEVKSEACRKDDHPGDDPGDAHDDADRDGRDCRYLAHAPCAFHPALLDRR